MGNVEQTDGPIFPTWVANDLVLHFFFIFLVHIFLSRNLAYDVELCSSLFTYESLKFSVIVQS